MSHEKYLSNKVLLCDTFVFISLSSYAEPSKVSLEDKQRSQMFSEMWLIDIDF